MSAIAHASPIQQRLAALAAQTEVAANAHASILKAVDTSEAGEIQSHFSEIETLAERVESPRFACHSKSQPCDVHARVDGLLETAERLLARDKEIADRILRQSASGSHLNVACLAFTESTLAVSANLSTLEAFVSSLRALAFTILAAAADNS